jgi:hypothetical protein
VIGGTLGLLAFLLAFTFGMAASRFDKRPELLHDELWSQALLVAQKDGSSEMHALFVDSLNVVIDFHTKRVVVSQYRIPDAIWLIANLERGSEGLLQVSQQPMIDLDHKLGASAP